LIEKEALVQQEKEKLVKDMKQMFLQFGLEKYFKRKRNICN